MKIRSVDPELTKRCTAVGTPLPADASVDALTEAEVQRIHEVNRVEKMGFVAVGLGRDGNQEYIDMLAPGDRPVLTSTPYEKRYSKP